MKKSEILETWLLSKMQTVYDILSDAEQALSKNDILDNEEPLWNFIDYSTGKPVDCTSRDDWVAEHTREAKPFQFEFAPFDFNDIISLRTISYDANNLYEIFSNDVELTSIDNHDFIAIEKAVSTLSERYNFFSGFQLKGFAVREPYINGPGVASREAGTWSLNTARKVLEKYGGLAGYRALPHGKKKPVREEIEKAIKAKDPRNVHIILNKIESLEDYEN